ncbi:MAG: cell division protein ZapA [Treponema sp.]|nr:cell division protein ZapA [Treponema sp.]
MPKSRFRIDILGTSLSIAADEDPAYLKSLLNRYQMALENTRKLTSLTDPLNLAVLTGFLLCDDIQKLQARRGDTESDEAERITLDLISRIDAALEKPNAAPF